VAGLVVPHRLEQGDVGPLPPCGGWPFSFSIRRTVSRNSRNVVGGRPNDMACMIEEEAWSERAGFDVMGEKSITTGPSS